MLPLTQVGMHGEFGADVINLVEVAYNLELEHVMDSVVQAVHKKRKSAIHSHVEQENMVFCLPLCS